MKIGLAGKGFIGEAVARKLRARGYEVEVASISLGFDFTKPDVVEDFIKRNDVIIQMAAMADLNDFEAKPLLGMKTNIWMTVLFANFCSKHKKRLYNISTMCVYGNSPDEVLGEDATPNPSEIYAEAKLAGEHIIKGYHKSFGLEYIILRVATTYGPEGRSALAPHVFMGQMLSGQTVTVHGDGKQKRTLTYIDDEAEGIVAAITHPEIVNETINITSEEELSVLEWIDIIGKVLSITPKIEFIKDRVGQTYREPANASKARRLLRWEAKVSFEEGIKKTYEWMQECWKEEQK